MWARALVILILAISLTGCASTKNFSQVKTLEDRGGQKKILLMPLDVELSSLQASGMTEPKAEWTENAKHLMLDELRRVQTERGFSLLEFDPKRVDNSPQSPLIATQKLHRVVGQSILFHKYSGAALPTKKERFDWTLGSETSAVGQEFGADYGLFLYVRDSYTSAGRVAMQVFAAAFGVGLQGGTQVGFTSLVDLRSGNVVWFNVLQDNGGDLRSEKGAATTIANLLEDMPQ